MRDIVDGFQNLRDILLESCELVGGRDSAHGRACILDFLDSS